MASKIGVAAGAACVCLLGVLTGLVSAAWSHAAVDYELRAIASPQTPPPTVAELAIEQQDALRRLDLREPPAFARDAALDSVATERVEASLDRDRASVERERAFDEREAALEADREKLIDLHAQTSRTIAEIERVLTAAGIDPAKVTAAADQPARPRGGPFVPWSERAVSDSARESAADAARRLASLTWGVARLQALRDVLAHMPLGSPLPQIEVFGGFGRRADPFTGRAASHEGLDLRGTTATPVFATAEGTVTFAAWYGDYGNMVEIDHGYGFTTRYAHLSRILVKAGTPVALGGQLGIVGGTGRVTAVHLHYEVRVDGRPRNPIAFLKAGQRAPVHPLPEEIAFAGFELHP
ncbi:MAG: peptidoglycan DD-metalloendopeptidase family protein [Proteobacteria bacterium]|nr:peptidoglycan DD-metalloendopeptidase family protein [Pseudomonadota bacterium]